MQHPGTDWLEECGQKGSVVRYGDAEIMNTGIPTVWESGSDGEANGKHSNLEKKRLNVREKIFLFELLPKFHLTLNGNFFSL